MESGIIQEKSEKKNELYFIPKKININANLNDILFFNRQKKAIEAENYKNYESIITYDNVTEKYIYEYLLLNKNKLNFSELENKTMIYGLSKEHFDNLNFEIEYFDFKKIFFDYIELIKNDINKARNNSIKQNIISLYSNDELLLNQPLSFKNNLNLMYYSLLNYLLPSSNDPIRGLENTMIKHNNVCILYQFIKKIETLSDIEIWNIIFNIISITKEYSVLNLREKLIKKQLQNDFSIINNGENIKCEIKNEILYGYNNSKNEIIRIPLINIFDIELIKKILNDKLIRITNINEIYDDSNLLECIKIEYLNIHNYYTPHLKILKKIIKDILTSESINEYIDKFTDHSSAFNPFKNDEYYDLLWDKCVHFVLFEEEKFQAKTFRFYHKTFLNALPIINYFNLDDKLIRLFNYSFFIVIVICEFLGHLEKMTFYYLFKKNIKIKNDESEDILFDDNLSDELDEEKKFLQLNFFNSIDNKSKYVYKNHEENIILVKLLTFATKNQGNINLVKTIINYIKEKKKEYLIEFKDNIVSLYKAHNNYNITQEEFNEILKIIPYSSYFFNI